MLLGYTGDKQYLIFIFLFFIIRLRACFAGFMGMGTMDLCSLP